jgi:hypothetical protein
MASSAQAASIAQSSFRAMATLLAISNALAQLWCPARVRGTGVYAYGRQHPKMAGILDKSINYDDERERG